MYVDNMGIHCSNADLSAAQCDLQSDLDSIQLWLQTNLNVGKSNVMLIGSQQKL